MRLRHRAVRGIDPHSQALPRYTINTTVPPRANISQRHVHGSRPNLFCVCHRTHAIMRLCSSDAVQQSWHVKAHHRRCVQHFIIHCLSFFVAQGIGVSKLFQFFLLQHDGPNRRGSVGSERRGSKSSDNPAPEDSAENANPPVSTSLQMVLAHRANCLPSD